MNNQINLEKDELKRLAHYTSYAFMVIISLLMILLPIPYHQEKISSVFGDDVSMIIMYEFLMFALLGYGMIWNRLTYQTTIKDLKRVVGKLGDNDEFTPEIENVFRQNIQIVEAVKKQERKQKNKDIAKQLQMLKKDNEGSIANESQTLLDLIDELKKQNAELSKKAEKYDELEREANE